MDMRKYVICAVTAFLLVLSGCAASPEEERKRLEMEADIDDILSQYVDPAEYGEPTDCLSDGKIRTYRALGDRHLLFEGKQGQFWVNELRGRCVGLDRYSTLIMRPSLAGRFCTMDRFSATDTAGMGPAGPSCALGEFRPITEKQLEEVESRLEMR